MAKNDKIIVAFLVSAGLFTVGSANAYVGDLSQSDKAGFLSLAKSDNSFLQFVDASPEVPGTQVAETKK